MLSVRFAVVLGMRNLWSCVRRTAVVPERSREHPPRSTASGESVGLRGAASRPRDRQAPSLAPAGDIPPLAPAFWGQQLAQHAIHLI